MFDLDYRPVFWGLVPKGDGVTRNQFTSRITKHYQNVLPKCTLIFGTEDEIRMAGGSQDITKALQKIRSLSKAVIIVKSNEFGCDIYTDDIEQPMSFPGFPVKVLNSKGASDVFLSGLLSGWLQGESWKKSAQLANAVEAIVVTRHSCAPALPCRSELNYFIEKYTTDPNVCYQEKIHQLHRNCGHNTEKERFVLAFDHRWQFEQSCDDVGRARSVISAFKQQIFQGFLQAREKNPQHNLAKSG